jgi:7-cyano-7-deazaguanine synthase
MSKKKAVVVLSGGQDSVTCLFMARFADYDVHAVTFDYGQRHRREILAARTVARLSGVPHEVIHLGHGILRGTSPLVSNERLEEYTNHNNLPGGLEKTFVPMRNQLFLTVAANRAYVLGTNILYTGVSAEDFGGYPDCRRHFINALEDASSLGTFTGDADTLPSLQIITPLMYMGKKETVMAAMRIPGCYEALAYSHTSYAGEYPPTSNDHASLLRAKGFQEAGIPDPLVLRAYLETNLQLPEWYEGVPELMDYFERVRGIMRYIQRLRAESPHV